MFGVLYDFELNSILQMQFFKYETCFEDYPYKQAHQETLEQISTPLQFFSQRKITVLNDGNDGGEAEVEVEEIIGGELKFMENMFLVRFLQFIITIYFKFNGNFEVIQCGLRIIS